VSVPKATMDENHARIFTQNNIRIAREFILMYAKTITHPVEDRSDNQLRFRVIAAD